jgi:hypothetical protein
MPGAVDGGRFRGSARGQARTSWRPWLGRLTRPPERVTTVPDGSHAGDSAHFLPAPGDGTLSAISTPARPAPRTVLTERPIDIIEDRSRKVLRDWLAGQTPGVAGRGQDRGARPRRPLRRRSSGGFQAITGRPRAIRGWPCPRARFGASVPPPSPTDLRPGDEYRRPSGVPSVRGDLDEEGTAVPGWTRR